MYDLKQNHHHHHHHQQHQRPCVLVFAGHDPSGGAGIHADIEAIAAQGAHALTVITALTTQDNDRVFASEAVASELILKQADCLAAKMPIAVIKIGLIAHAQQAAAIAAWIASYRAQALAQGRAVAVVLDPVLASGHGDTLQSDGVVQDPAEFLAALIAQADLVTPNLVELERFAPNVFEWAEQAQSLFSLGAVQVLLKGGHGHGVTVVNRWLRADRSDVLQWQWTRLVGEFHGSGCTLAAAIAGQLAQGKNMEAAMFLAQEYVQHSLENAYAISDGQAIPARSQRA
jgi:hydroxymethylpyrimidine/phosphomethylpyrimidine kinase